VRHIEKSLEYWGLQGPKDDGGTANGVATPPVLLRQLMKLRLCRLSLAIRYGYVVQRGARSADLDRG